MTFRGSELKRTLVRVSSFAATSAAALGIFALCNAAPTYPAAPPAAAHRTAGTPDFVLAAMNPPAGDDTLAADAAAAGETARLGQGVLPRYAAPAYAPPATPAPAPAAPPPLAHSQSGADEDAIDELVRPQPAPDTAVRRNAPVRREARAEPAVRRHHATLSPPPPLTHATLRAHHHAVHHRLGLERPAQDLGREAQAATPPETPVAPPAPVRVRPHHLHIVVEPPRRARLQSAPETAAVNPTLPEIEAAPPAAPAPVDVKAALAQMTHTAGADMRAARFELSSALSRGRDGAAVVTLPAGLLSQLQQDAEDAGLQPDGPISVTVTLSGQGYGIVPEGAQTSRAVSGHPATFTWGVDPRGAAGGTLTATMTAVLPVEGEDRTVPLGVLTAEIPPPPVVATSPRAVTAPAPAPAAAPAGDLGNRMRADLGKLGVPDPSDFRLRDLAIPGYPTLDVPLLGEVPSEKVVAAGLILLAFLFVQSLLRGAGVRAERRRRLAELEDGYFTQGRL